MKQLIFIGLFLCCALGYGQREAANWYFGSNAGLDFNSGSPVPLLDGVLDTVEGCETISTPDGDLLFYTEGKNVWNRNHDVMPNGDGLNGSFSATQSALVIPLPGSSSIYYIFTSDVVQSYQDGGNGNGFNYSIVDMSLSAGLGDVTVKNQNLLPQGSEKVTGVLAADGENYWVITHFQNRFYAYFVDSTGLNPTPVISTIGPNIDDFNNIRGAIKSSPNGSKLAVAHAIFEPSFDGSFLLYDFDTTTGVISNEQLLADDLVFYGAEFSSDSSKLYASGKEINIETGATDNIIILQFDLEATDVVGSRFTIADIPNLFQSDLGGTLQIAIDRKIYHSIPNANLSVIRTPNFPRLDSDFRRFTIDLGGRSTKFGLPPFIQSFFESIVEVENFCLGDDTQFTVISDEPILSINWNFGDPASGADNTSTLLNPTHRYTAPGVYTVRFVVDYVSRPSREFIEFVEIGDIPIVNSGVELVQCDIDGVDDGISRFDLNQALFELVDSPRNFTINFFRTLEDAENNQNALEELGYVNEFDGQVIYARVFENALCFAIEPITLRVEPMAYAGDISLVACNRSGNPDFEAIVDLVDFENQLLDIYPGADISFYDTLDDALLELNPLVDTVLFTIFDTVLEVYYRVEYDNDCASIGRIVPDIRPVPQAENLTVEICPNETIVLDPGDFAGYLWESGETTRTIEVSSPGIYLVDVFNGEGCNTTISINVSEVPNPGEVEVVVEDFQQNNRIIITIPEDQPWEYQLDGGALQLENTFNDVSPGFHTVSVYLGSCLLYQEELFVGGAPNYFTPNADGFNDLWHMLNRLEYPGAEIKIYDRFGKLLHSMLSNQDGWDGTYRGNPMPSSDYWYLIRLPDGRNARGHFSLIRR